MTFCVPALTLAGSMTCATLSGMGLSPIVTFPPVHVFKAVNFVYSVLLASVLKFRGGCVRFFSYTYFKIVLTICTLALPRYPMDHNKRRGSLMSTVKLQTFALFGRGGVTVFFVFSVLLKISLRVAGNFTGPFLDDFGKIPRCTSAFKIGRTGTLVSLSRISRALYVLLVPFILGRFKVGHIVLVTVLT